MNVLAKYTGKPPLLKRFLHLFQLENKESFTFIRYNTQRKESAELICSQWLTYSRGLCIKPPHEINTLRKSPVQLYKTLYDHKISEANFFWRAPTSNSKWNIAVLRKRMSKDKARRKGKKKTRLPHFLQCSALSNAA
jgi:hypothetical protein